MKLYDVIIIGGGPAGLNAAVVLGRCRRKVVLFDTGKPRNHKSAGMHNYLTRDDILPRDFIHIAHDEIKKYHIEFYHTEILNAIKNEDGNFMIKDWKGNVYHSKKLLIATGLVDKLPNVEGFEDFYGKSIFHCPYCDGWEMRDKKIGVYARIKNGFDLALSLKTWSFHVTLFTDGKYYLKKNEKKILIEQHIPVITTPVQKLVGEDGMLRRIIFKNEKSQLCDAIFFANGFSQHCELIKELGCKMSTKNCSVITNKKQQTNISGLYVAGDAARDMHFVIVAAAEGAKAAVMINKELQKEELKSVVEELM